MKKVFVALTIASLVIVGLTSCDKLKDALFPSFETSAGTFQVTVPVITNTSTEASLASANVYFNLDSTVRAYTKGKGDFSINNVNSVKVKNVQITLLNGTQNSNLANFENAKVTLSSSANTTPAVIASTTIADNYATSLNITDANAPELKEYLKGSTFTYSILGKPRRATTQALNLLLTVTLSVK